MWLIVSANFIRFLGELGISTKDTEMTFGVSRDAGAFEWAGTSLSAIFAQPRNVVSLRMWHMIFDILRFNQYALDLLAEEEESEVDPSVINGHDPKAHQPRGQQTIGEYLDKHGYSEAFRNDYLIPMTASVWSTHPDKASLDFPAITLVRFLWNHHLLNTISSRPTWRTIPGGTSQYIDAVMKTFPKSNIHLRTSVDSLNQEPDGRIVLETSMGPSQAYNYVLLATHGDQARHITRQVSSDEERKILSGFNTSTNTAVLHSDISVSHRSAFWRAILIPGSVADASSTAGVVVVELSNRDT